MNAKNGKAPQTRCIACLEIIQPGAKICPRCHSPQSPQRWNSIPSLGIDGLILNSSLVSVDPVAAAGVCSGGLALVLNA